MRILLVMVGLLVSLVAQPQEIYRWVDKDGIVHYADQPGSPDAELVPYPALGVKADGDEGNPPLYESPQQDQPPVGPTYQSLQIVSPTPDQVFFGGDVSVTVEVALDRDLRPGDTLLIFVDGNRTQVDGLTTTLTGLSRGTHFVRAAVVDQAGSIVITSAQQTFHLRQSSVATPPTGPKIKPPPPRPGTTPPASPNNRPG